MTALDSVSPRRTPGVLFIDRSPSSGFMRLDRRAFEASFHVEVVEYPGSPTIGFLRECFRALKRVDAIFVFFASENAIIPAALAVLFGKRLVLVPAGYDYANMPEHGYGLAAQGKGLVPRLVGRAASVALPISQQSLWEFLTMVPSAAPRTRLGHLALEPEEWPDSGVTRDKNTIVTFGHIDEEAYGRKGIDRFVEAAATDPGRRYVIGGGIEPAVKARIESRNLPNLELAGHLSHDALRQLLYSCTVYAQLSWHETFGVSMAEAMLCGCVPVISTNHSIGEVAGRWAVVSSGPEADAAAIEEGIRRAETIDRAAMRSDLAKRFSFERRVQMLHDAVVGER